jgi:hypothetical protein
VFFEASTKAARVRLFGELRLFCVSEAGAVRLDNKNSLSYQSNYPIGDCRGRRRN